MLARVTTLEGATADGLRAAAAEFRSRAATGPPEGVKSTGVMLLIDPEGGRALVIGLFENEEDLRASEPALEAMNPPEGLGTRTGKDVYEVGAEARM
jgi:hypothetical protein